MAVLAKKWLPGQPLTARSMGQAVWLESDFWEKMSIAVCNGIAKAFKG
jgi:hypothetical protein